MITSKAFSKDYPDTDTNTGIDPISTQYAQLKAFCSKEFLDTYPDCPLWIDIAVTRLNQVLALRNKPLIRSLTLDTVEKESNLYIPLEKEIRSSVISPDKSVDVNFAVSAIEYFLEENNAPNVDRKTILLTSNKIKSSNGHQYFGAAAENNVIISMLHVEDAIRNPELINAAIEIASSKTGKPIEKLEYLKDPDFIRREAFIRLVMHEVAHTCGIPIEEGSTNYDKRLYHDEFGIHCIRSQIEPDSVPRICIMNQRSDLNEWLSQLFTERILNIDFCDCCKNGQLQQNPEIKVLSLEESYSSFREDNYNRNNTDKFPSSFQFNFEVFIDDNKYDVSFSSLADYGSLHISVNGRVTWFETSDIFAESVIYRPHIYVSYNDGKSISYEEKLKRITEWQDTFLVLDALMVDVENNISNQEMLALLKQGKIPRASLTEHGTRIRSFEYLISKINQQGNYTEASMKVPWELWIKAARENKIVEYWQEYKNKLMQ